VRIERSQTIAAPVEEVWRIAADPHHLPRWWPATQRVEGVSDSGWTSVFTTPRGRTVRADYSVLTTEAPSLARWRQEVAGTPFERLFSAVEYELRLEPDAGGTRAALGVNQKARGMARFGGIQLRRAAGRQLDTALAALAEAVP